MPPHFQAHAALAAVVVVGGAGALQGAAVHAVQRAGGPALAQQVDLVGAQAGLAGQGMQRPEEGLVAPQQQLQADAGAGQAFLQGARGVLRIGGQQFQFAGGQPEAGGQGAGLVGVGLLHHQQRLAAGQARRGVVAGQAGQRRGAGAESGIGHGFLAGWVAAVPDPEARGLVLVRIRALAAANFRVSRWGKYFPVANNRSIRRR